MNAAVRLSTSWLLLGEFGPTMSEGQFRERFAPKDADKTFRNKVSADFYPPLRNGVFDTQEVGQWWDSLPTRRQ